MADLKGLGVKRGARDNAAFSSDGSAPMFGLPWSAIGSRWDGLEGGLRRWVVVLFAATAVAGCSGNDPEALPSDTPSAPAAATSEPEQEPSGGPVDGQSASPPPTDTPSPTPDPTAELEAELTEFFEEYIDAVNKSWSSEVALRRRREMFADSCQACHTGYEFAERVHNEHLVFEGADAVVKDVQLTSFEAEMVVFLTLADYPAGRLLDSDGSVVMEFDEAKARQTVYQATRESGGTFVIVASEAL